MTEGEAVVCPAASTDLAGGSPLSTAATSSTMAARATSDLTDRWSEPMAPAPALPGAGAPAPATRPFAPASPGAGESATAPHIAADSRPGAVGTDLAILGASRYRFRQAIPVSARNRPVLTSSATPMLRVAGLVPFRSTR